MPSFAALLGLVVAVLLGCPARAAAGGWVPPLAGPLAVRRAFEPPRTRWGPGHRGVDLAAPAGAVVIAAGAGEVTFAGVIAGRGVVAVTHGGMRTTYEPVVATVGAGERVRAGEPVGVLRGGHAGPAGPGEALLHWGLLRGDTYLDPLSLLRRGPSRLLPVSPAPAAPWPAPLAAGAPAVPAGAAPPAPAPVPPGVGAAGPVPVVAGRGRSGRASRGPGVPLAAGALAAGALAAGAVTPRSRGGQSRDPP
ncbi:MAG TPA: peptidoglycan DD-metalloendopeptidase family protein [Mycobacteriales bacterium]|jgi:hypothetical protein|nr:peptidoglycan DD-metalloendopeptidase family protein [Mycobacteriales bacterium]